MDRVWNEAGEGGRIEGGGCGLRRRSQCAQVVPWHPSPRLLWSKPQHVHLRRERQHHARQERHNAKGRSRERLQTGPDAGLLHQLAGPSGHRHHHLLQTRHLAVHQEEKEALHKPRRQLPQAGGGKWGQQPVVPGQVKPGQTVTGRVLPPLLVLLPTPSRLRWDRPGSRR